MMLRDEVDEGIDELTGKLSRDTTFFEYAMHKRMALDFVLPFFNEIPVTPELKKIMAIMAFMVIENTRLSQDKFK